MMDDEAALLIESYRVAHKLARKIATSRAFADLHESTGRRLSKKLARGKRRAPALNGLFI
jgi:hypothetical protein